MKWFLIHYREIAKHKFWVALYMFRACLVIMKRAIVHDLSKFSRAERKHFVEALPRLRELDYGSSKYKEALAQLGPALTHHYENNRHHPEFYQNGIQDMTPLDILEMLCDWKAATKRHANGNYEKSLVLNMERFGYSPEFLEVLRRTSQAIGLL